MTKKIRLKEGVWHISHLSNHTHRWMDLPKDQMERIHFAMVKKKDKNVQYFIILPKLKNKII